GDASVRTDRQLFAQPDSKLRSDGWRHFLNRFALLSYRHRIRVPEIVEVGVHNWNSDDLSFDRLKTCIFPQRLQGIAARDRSAGRTWRRHPQRFHRDVNGMNGCSTTRDIPHVRAYPAAGPDDSCHFRNGLARVGEERDDERHDSNIETVIAKGKCLRITDPELCRLCSGPRSRKGELALRGIDTNNFGRSTASDKRRGEGAIATPPSSHRTFAGMSNQSRKISPASRLQRPMSRS